MNTERPLAFTKVPAIGLGCMNLSHAYGIPPAIEAAEKVLQAALDMGIVHFDTASLYGFGKNEKLVGPYLKSHRDQIFLASKCVLFERDGERFLDGSPEAIKRVCDESLQRLQADVIDLYYLHRLDQDVPIEDSMGAMADLVKDGKILSVGVSEMSADTIRRAAAVHPVAAVQSEYSLWTRNVEIGVIDACRELNAALVCFSTLARGFLADMQLDPSEFVPGDIRLAMPRFQEPNFSSNRDNLLPAYLAIAERVGCSPAQLAIAWVLHQAEFIHVIPGTTSVNHLREDWDALSISLETDVLDELDQLINQGTVAGTRYNETVQKQIDTEEF